MLLKVVDEIEEEQTKFAPLDDKAAKDTLLVVAAKNGDGQAFEILVCRYRAKMLRAALRFTRNEADAEDIVQQSFQKAFLHLRQFEGHSSFSTWLTRIAINEALMWLRKRGSVIEIPIEQPNAENGATVSLDFPDSGLSPEDNCVQEEQKGLLSEALNQLTPRLRRAIEIREIGELSTEEAARAMGLTVQAVKARVFHGRKKLQKVMKRLMSQNHSWRRSRGERFTSRNPRGGASLAPII
jgi:RNA polymerase sigma-70 factor, ECF subfamily